MWAMEEMPLVSEYANWNVYCSPAGLLPETGYPTTVA